MAGEDLVRTRRAEIRRVAQSHGVDTIRWWPPRKADFLIGELPQSLRELRSDLERVLGCKVSIYLSEQQPEEVRRRLAEQTIDLEEGAT
jgi:flagellar motor switch protein FliG